MAQINLALVAVVWRLLLNDVDLSCFPTIYSMAVNPKLCLLKPSSGTSRDDAVPPLTQPSDKRTAARKVFEVVLCSSPDEFLSITTR
ncbi:hypothetical protein B0H10DRAFT_1223573 [Mycena sp. CBHHK59/15]|nr:hypothetical protein B0H10DRAFT_1223573 [Mycena sp. CBHHK59/15]